MFICWCVYAWILHLIQYNTIYDQRKFGWQKSGGSGGTFFSKWSNSRWHKIKRADLVLVLVLGELTPATWICGYTRKMINSYYSTQGGRFNSSGVNMTKWHEMIWDCMISGWKESSQHSPLGFSCFRCFRSGAAGLKDRMDRMLAFSIVVGRSLDKFERIPQPSWTVHRCTSSSAKSTSKNYQSNKNYKKIITSDSSDLQNHGSSNHRES